MTSQYGIELNCRSIVAGQTSPAPPTTDNGKYGTFEN